MNPLFSRASFSGAILYLSILGMPALAAKPVEDCEKANAAIERTEVSSGRYAFRLCFDGDHGNRECKQIGDEKGFSAKELRNSAVINAIAGGSFSALSLMPMVKQAWGLEVVTKNTVAFVRLGLANHELMERGTVWMVEELKELLNVQTLAKGAAMMAMPMGIHMITSISAIDEMTNSLQMNPLKVYSSTNGLLLISRQEIDPKNLTAKDFVCAIVDGLKTVAGFRRWHALAKMAENKVSALNKTRHAPAESSACAPSSAVNADPSPFTEIQTMLQAFPSER